MRLLTSVGAMALFCTGSAANVWAEPPPIVATTFEKDAGDWRIMNVTGGSTEAAKLTVSHEAADIKEGVGSLKFDYTVKKGDTNLLMLPLQAPSLVKMKSLHFWVKSDHATSMMLVLSEKDGGRYQSTFTCGAKVWQEVSIALSDLTLNEDEGSPKDPDGKLDPDQIEGVGLIDADCYLAQFLGDMPQIINIGTGAHTLLLNSFTIGETALPAVPATAGEQLLLPLVRPQVGLLVLGDISVEKVTEKPLSGASIKASYTQSKMKVFGLLKSVKVGSFAGVTQLKYSAASKNPVTLMVQLEDTNGNKFNSNNMIPGGSESKEYAALVADFNVAPDSKDPAAKLDLALVKQILFIDVSGFGDIPDAANSLWINNLRTVQK